MSKHNALWKGRFADSPDADAIQFETSIFVDSRLALDDIAGSKAHAKMLGDSGIISADEAATIVGELENIEHELASGTLTIDTTFEDIHSFIEGLLTDRTGDIGRKLHTGRSRNDQIALDERLYLLRAIPDLQGRVRSLIETLVGIAEQHTETLLSGYTHLQKAQLVTLAHHLCAWAWMLVRDDSRLQDALKRINLSPLGAGALAGSSLPLDRLAVAESLGFEGITQNSLDTVADRDYCVELAAHLALLMAHLSRFCEEVIVWSTEEFNFIELSEKWSTGSSIMPQKKNPDFAELIRGRTGKVYGDLIALLTMLKGLPLAYNRDMQEDKASLFDAYDTVYESLGVFTAMIGSAKWNTGRMAASCTGGYANATDVAEYLVKKGLPFRTAHTVSAQIVRFCIGKKCNIENLTLSSLQTAAGTHSALIAADIYAKITPAACVTARDIPGGPAPERVKSQIATLKGYLKGEGVPCSSPV
jgi:argininosuccinate lyase